MYTGPKITPKHINKGIAGSSRCSTKDLPILLRMLILWTKGDYSRNSLLIKVIRLDN